MTEQDQQAEERLQRFGVRATAYGAACLIVVICLIGLGGIPDRGDIQLMLPIFLFVLAFALPGYLALRWLMARLRQEGPVAFGLMGLLNMLIVLVLISGGDFLSGAGQAFTTTMSMVQVLWPMLTAYVAACAVLAVLALGVWAKTGAQRPTQTDMVSTILAFGIATLVAGAPGWAIARTIMCRSKTSGALIFAAAGGVVCALTYVGIGTWDRVDRGLAPVWPGPETWALACAGGMLAGLTAWTVERLLRGRVTR